MFREAFKKLKRTPKLLNFLFFVVVIFSAPSIDYLLISSVEADEDFSKKSLGWRQNQSLSQTWTFARHQAHSFCSITIQKAGVFGPCKVEKFFLETLQNIIGGENSTYYLQYWLLNIHRGYSKKIVFGKAKLKIQIYNPIESNDVLYCSGKLFLESLPKNQSDPFTPQWGISELNRARKGFHISQL